MTTKKPTKAKTARSYSFAECKAISGYAAGIRIGEMDVFIVCPTRDELEEGWNAVHSSIYPDRNKRCDSSAFQKVVIVSANSIRAEEF